MRLSPFNVVSLTLGFVFLYLPMLILVIYSFNASKLVTVWDSLTTGRSDGALVRFTTPVMSGETMAAADKRILRLMAETLPTLPRFLPH